MFKITNIQSLFEIILPGVRHGSILRHLLFNTFLSDLFLFIKKSDLRNFADDNTIESLIIF